MEQVNIRAWDWESDDPAALTELLHRAYAELLEMGLRFTATAQPVETTIRRLREGFPFVAELDGRIVGTITVVEDDQDGIPLYAQPGVWYFTQFGVEPDLKKSGIGKQLHDHVCEFALAHGCHSMALDTSDQATHLIALYERWGYRIVDTFKWNSVNYHSVVMAQPLK